MSLPLRWMAPLCALSMACSSAVRRDGEGGTSSTASGGSGGSPSNTVPQVVLDPSPGLIHEGETVTFFATVTDPDGPQDVLGGLLRDETGVVTFSSFTLASPGSYSATVSWLDVHSAEPINFQTSTTRIFRADFTDSAQNVGTATAGVTLVCDGGCAAVNGMCVCGPPVCMIDCTTINTPPCLQSVCNDGSYQGVIGECVIVPLTAGAVCDDGIFCTVNDACNASGTCIGGAPNECGMVPPECQVIVCNEGTQSCSQQAEPNGSLCSTGQCQSGQCV